MEQLTIHITVGPHSKATFHLTYEEVLKRHLMQYDIVIKVKPKQLVNHFEVSQDDRTEGMNVWAKGFWRAWGSLNPAPSSIQSPSLCTC